METRKASTVSTRRTLMQEKLDALVRTQAMQLFRQQGLHFTMQQVAEPLHISKKTIYTVYPSKEALLLDMVDHAFADIHRCKQEILAGSGTLQEKLRAVIIAMPTEYAALDLQQMKELDEKYPVVAARVRSQLENGWEPTMALLEQAVAEGIMRPVSLPVLRQMITASIESFLADRSLAESGVQYVAVLEEMGKDYVLGTKSRGIPFSWTLRRSILRASFGTILTLLALSIGSLLGGTAIVESIFMWDGVGKLAVDAIHGRDYPMIQAYVVWMAFIYVVVNLLTDIVYRIADPQIGWKEGRRR
jgi:AcrR family transcriptional regulator